jgi:uncharacterized protein (UPF0548 family)
MGWEPADNRRRGIQVVGEEIPLRARRLAQPEIVPVFPIDARAAVVRKISTMHRDNSPLVPLRPILRATLGRPATSTQSASFAPTARQRLSPLPFRQNNGGGQRVSRVHPAINADETGEYHPTLPLALEIALRTDSFVLSTSYFVLSTDIRRPRTHRHFHMPSFLKPNPAALRRTLAAQSQLDFTYPNVGATANLSHSPFDISDSFNVDHTRVELGDGPAVFERAKAALGSWQQFGLGWLEVFPPGAPLRAGETVLVLARAGGLWWTNAARIVYTIDDRLASRYGFAYGTLPAHVESGEERFLIEWDRTTDRVYFDILAFSHPRNVLVRLNHRRARAMQKRFASEAAAAIKRAATTGG